MYNKIILAGNPTRDIEIRYTSANLAIGHTSIAVNRKFKSKTGEQKEEVLFIDLNFFGRTAEIANQYLRRGSKVLAEGRLKLDQWTDSSGNKRSRHSVTVETMQMLDSKQERGDTAQTGPTANLSDDHRREQVAAAQSEPRSTEPKPVTMEEIVNEGEIPF